MDKIIVGDVVDVALDMTENCYLADVTVMYIPVFINDAWKFKDRRGCVYIVQNYGHITKKSTEVGS